MNDEEQKYFLEQTLKFSGELTDLTNLMLGRLPRDMGIHTARMILVNAHCLAFASLLGNYCHLTAGGDLHQLTETIYHDHQKILEDLLAKHSKKMSFSLKIENPKKEKGNG